MTEMSCIYWFIMNWFLLQLNTIYFFVTEIFKRILQVVLKIRYDVESLDQKLQQIEKKIEENGLIKTVPESTYNLDYKAYK